MTVSRRNTVIAMFVALAGSTAHAGDQGITGKKLFIKSDKIVVLSKDPTIGVTESDPIGGSDSSITFTENSAETQLDLPATGWSSNGAGTIFKYKNVLAPAGPSSVKLIKIKTGLIKAVVKRVPEAVPNGPASVGVVLNLDGSSNSYCMNFTGSGDGKTFSAKDAGAGSCNPPAPMCGNDVREDDEVCDGADATACPGACLPDCTCPPPLCPDDFVEHAGGCWSLADGPDLLPHDCDTFCAFSQMTYDPATASYAGSEGTDSNCQAVLTALGVPMTGWFSSLNCDAGLGCTVVGLGATTRCASPPTTSNADGPVQGAVTLRVCACQ